MSCSPHHLHVEPRMCGQVGNSPLLFRAELAVVSSGAEQCVTPHILSITMKPTPRAPSTARTGGESTNISLMPH